jgi:hypothetical protein
MKMMITRSQEQAVFGTKYVTVLTLEMSADETAVWQHNTKSITKNMPYPPAVRKNIDGLHNGTFVRKDKDVGATFEFEALWVNYAKLFHTQLVKHSQFGGTPLRSELEIVPQ